MIHLTHSAQTRAQRYIGKEPGAIGIHIAVKKSGCSGYGYDIKVVTQPPENATSFNYGDFEVFVNHDDLPMLNGLTLDVKKQGLNESFTFDNPQAQATCGCGTSFSLTE